MATQSSRSTAHRIRGLYLTLVVGALSAAVVATAGCSATSKSATPQAAPAETSATTQEATPAAPVEAPQEVTKLQIKDLKVGTGAKVKKGDSVDVNYTGWLMDGSQFDTGPFTVVVGETPVIQGWHEGLVGMQVGGKRQLIIPPDLAYGKEGYPPDIPPDATLRFEIDLLKLTPGK